MSVTLKPKFGYLEVFSLPEQDANVYIDGMLAGQTPYKSDRMPIRDYRIRIEKDLFFPIDTLVSISSGETNSQTFTMIPPSSPKSHVVCWLLAEVGLSFFSSFLWWYDRFCP